MPIHSPGKAGRYDLENSIGYLVNRAAQLIAARFADDLKVHDVNLQAWRILAALSHAEQQSVSELADHTGAELSYVSRSITNLEAQNLVERHASVSDKRAVHVFLTEEGKALVKALAPKGQHIERSSVVDVSTADLRITLNTLRKVCHNLVAGGDPPAASNHKLSVARRVMDRTISREAKAAPARKRALKPKTTSSSS